jgi:hypothetical protein
MLGCTGGLQLQLPGVSDANVCGVPHHKRRRVCTLKLCFVLLQLLLHPEEHRQVVAVHTQPAQVERNSGSSSCQLASTTCISYSCVQVASLVG